MTDLSVTIYIQKSSLPGTLWLSISTLFYNLFSLKSNQFCLDLTQLPKTWFKSLVDFSPTDCFSTLHSSHVVIYPHQVLQPLSPSYLS